MGFCEVDIERPEKETGKRGGGPIWGGHQIIESGCKTV